MQYVAFALAIYLSDAPTPEAIAPDLSDWLHHLSSICSSFCKTISLQNTPCGSGSM